MTKIWWYRRYIKIENWSRKCLHFEPFVLLTIYFKVYISLVGFFHIQNLLNVLIYIGKIFFNLDFSLWRSLRSNRQNFTSGFKMTTQKEE